MQGRYITIDKLYTAIPTTDWLLEQRVTKVGTLSTNYVGIPDKIKFVDNTENHSSQTSWEQSKGGNGDELLYFKAKI